MNDICYMFNPLWSNDANFGHICPKSLNLHNYVDISPIMMIFSVIFHGEVLSHIPKAHIPPESGLASANFRVANAENDAQTT